jgi:cell division protein FtsN
MTSMSDSDSSPVRRGAAARWQAQRGGFAMGLVVGLLVGLALALGVALWVTKVPVPFVNKVPQRTAEQDAAEAERNRSWDPNAPLATKTRPATTAPASGPAAAAGPPAAGAAPVAPAVVGGTPRDPAAILSGKPVAAPATASPATPGASPGASPAAAPATAPAVAAGSAGNPPGAGTEPYVYFVQAGAYSRTDEAEQQRARLAIMGLDAKVTEREQSGRTMYRVRVGPYPQREQAETAKGQIDGAGMESVLVRVQRAN